MANEVQNKRDVNWGRDYHTDATTDQAIQELESTKSDGVSGEEMDKFLSSSADGSQITEREYSAMNRWVQQNYALLSPEAREKWSKFDQAMRGAGGRGDAEKHHSKNDVVILGGPALTSVLADIAETGKAAPPPAPQPDGVHGADGPAASPPAPTPTPPPHPNPAPPAPEPQVPSGIRAVGNSWGEIFAALLVKLGEKDVELRKRGQELAGPTKTKSDGASAPKTEGGGTEGTQASGSQASGNENVSEQAKLEQFRIDLQELQRLFQTVSQIAQSIHDTAKQSISNIRA